ncbi:NAD(P)/FAD-dependent oxidoreductase [Deinococcus koreensis]|nr:FAD-dependent oxidoreductase [Deinococcus koreensis]
MKPHVIVIGGGVAGASVAYFLGRAGRAVTVVDAGVAPASHVPSALINPVRGQAGRVPEGALQGLALTWALIEELGQRGIHVPHGRGGVLRPVPDEATRRKFDRHRPDGLEAHWLSPEEAPVSLAPGWHAALFLPQGGWLDGAAFVVGLIAASGARVVQARAQRWDARTVTLEGGDLLDADAVVFCGGSVGSTWAGERATHRMGTLLQLDRAVTGVPLSFGAYLAPSATGGVLGATFEAPAQSWQPPALPLASLGWLLGKGEALADPWGVQVTGRWTGSRLSGLSCGRSEGGVWRLSGLGSQGFLLGPLLARGLAGDIGRHVAGDGASPAAGPAPTHG